jgi:putative ABC transport system permease protein
MLRSLRLAFLALTRDWRSGELQVLLLAIFVAVTSLTAVGFFTSRVSQAVDEQAGEVLAADLRLQASHALNDDYAAQATAAGLRTAQVISFPSVVLFREESSLAAVHAVSGGYPLRGQVRIADAPFAEGQPTNSLPASGEVWVDARLLARLGAGIGQSLRVGSKEFIVREVLDRRPDQGSQFTDLAPALLMRADDLPATGLVRNGSRISYALLMAGDTSQIAAFKPKLEAAKQPGERLVDIADASPQIKEAVEKSGRFLNLAALVTILLAAVAVAIAARRYAARHLDSAALMKSLGASQRRILQMSIGELLLVALIGNVIGVVAGFLAQLGLAWLLKGFVPGVLPPPSLSPIGVAFVTSIIMLLGFALPPLLRLKSVPPARVLRSNLEPPPLKYASVYGTAFIAIVGMLYWLVRDPRLVAYVVAGNSVMFAVLFAAGALLVKSLSGLRGSVGVAWRYGIANIARRGRDSVVQIVAFGLGLMVLLLLLVVRNDLLRDWRASLPVDAPNHFLFNIRPEQSAGVNDFFNSLGVHSASLVPMVRARMTAINGVPTGKLKFAGDRANSFVDREANLTWFKDLPPDNKILAGKWWQPGDGPQVSVEADIAAELHLNLGDQLTYDVAGESVTVRVASFRKVQWDTFRPNFFLVFSPGVIDNAAGTYVTSVKLDGDQRRHLVDLVRRYPEITIIDIGAVIDQVRSVMDRATLAVQYVFGFTLLAGIAVLLAAVQATRDERRYESAMLRTLGARRRTVLQGVAAEFTVLGILSGILASFGATVTGYWLASGVFHLKYTLDPMIWLIGLVGGAVLVGVSGTLATRSVVNHPPIATLRGGG